MPRVAKDSQCNELKAARIQALLQTQPKNNGVWAVHAQHCLSGEPGLGLAIAKKFAKRAVDRNRLKRSARELVRAARQNQDEEFVVRLRRAIGVGTQGKLRHSEYQSLKVQLKGLIS